MFLVFDVMQIMGLLICFLYLQMEEMNKFVLDFVVIVIKEKYMFGKCENLLVLIVVLEVMN